MEIAIDLAPVLTGLEKKFEKDARNIGLFTAAVAKKEVEISQQQTQFLLPFLEASTELVAKWWHKALHLQFPKDFEGDPFFDLRNETRAFAAHWVLDPVFIMALG